jgi:hypothetical protein
MQKREKVTLAIIGILLFNIFIASASMQITQPLRTYNFGDSIFTTITLNPSSVSGSFEINVVCENKSANVYKIAPAEGAFTENREQKVNHKITLTREFIGALGGNCHILSSIASESVTSDSFYLSDDITLLVKLDKTNYNPEEKITWTIDAKKSNGLPLNGYVEISGLINSNLEIKDGKLTGSAIIPANSEANKYNLSVLAYDKDNNGILNQEKSFGYFEINQVPTKIDISMLGFEAVPGEEFSFGVDLYDQSSKKMPGILSLAYTSEQNIQKKLDVQADSIAKLNFSYNATPGKYLLTLSKDSIKTQKEFTLKAVPRVNIELTENSSILIVKNIGNTIYNDSLGVTIGEQLTTIPLNLQIGEEKKFNLQAPDGSYSVIAQSGESTATRNLLLTGDVISIREGSGTIIFEASPIIWVFIVGVLLLLAVVIFMKNKKRTFKFNEKHRNIREETPTLVQVSKKAHMQKQFLDLAQPRVSEAESNISMKGSKNLCSIISLNIKNKATLGLEATKKLNEVLEQTQSKLGVVDMRSQHILVIFSPLLTKTFNNELVAVKAADSMKIQLDDYNKRFSDKINYNIGIHSGEMINSLNNGKLNYTSLGNSIILAKRISDLGNEKLLVSGTFRQKLLRELKAQKITHALGNVDVFEVQRIADTEANQEKLKQLLKRTSFS